MRKLLGFADSSDRSRDGQDRVGYGLMSAVAGDRFQLGSREFKIAANDRQPLSLGGKILKNVLESGTDRCETHGIFSKPYGSR
ncbi:hypothetical protein [Micromonospora sp. Llam0]|uniref:hypothetical protein n=1 Tax=Micromonospora sp. Llam0 TaxID=2485143 RepID=UPI0011CEAEC9|nr:hypothetical protein [Micromonospora sp. Llam0]